VGPDCEPSFMSQALKGHRALVTGASRGIGLAIARALAAEGADLVITGRTVQTAEEGARQVQGQGRLVPLACDFCKTDDAKRLADAAVKALGGIDILINNAGSLHVGSLEQTSSEQFQEQIQVNLNGPFTLIRALVPGMVGRRKGRVINISSISGTLGTPRLSAYCASKWGLNGLTKALAEELKGTGVLMAAVLPGSTDTEMLKRAGFTPSMQPAEVASVVKFLCTDAPEAMQGSLVEVFG
jgi:3-oxoacyl-[acyl-carrier protein] reductase